VRVIRTVLDWRRKLNAKVSPLQNLGMLFVLLNGVLFWPYIESLPQSVFRSRVVTHARMVMSVPHGWRVSRTENAIQFSKLQFSIFGTAPRSVGIVQVQPSFIGFEAEWLARTRAQFEKMAASNVAPRFISGRYGSFDCYGYESSRVPTKAQIACLDGGTGLASFFVGSAVDIEPYLEILTTAKPSSQ
jgi:hypothetical protein